MGSGRPLVRSRGSLGGSGRPLKGNVSLFGTDILFVTRHLLKNDEIYGGPTFSTSEISITFA